MAAEQTDVRPLPQRVIAWALSLPPVRAYLRYSEHRGPMLADAVTYQTLFSLFAAVLMGFSIAGLWLSGNETAWAALIDAVDNAVPGLVGEGGLINPDSIAVPAGLTLAGIISLLGLFWSAFGAIGSLRSAIREIADQGNDDGLFIWVVLRNIALGLGIGLGLAASAVATLIGTAFLDVLDDWLGVPLGEWGPRLVAIGVTFALDAVIVAVAFLVLSGVRPPAGILWSGALLGAVGLTVLQQLSGLFVGGAGRNPLLATFASLIALLLWLNLSTQVILLASSFIVTRMEDRADRVRARYGAQTFLQRRVQRAEIAVSVAADELAAAREAADKERTALAEKLAEKAAKAP